MFIARGPFEHLGLFFSSSSTSLTRWMTAGVLQEPAQAQECLLVGSAGLRQFRTSDLVVRLEALIVRSTLFHQAGEFRSQLFTNPDHRPTEAHFKAPPMSMESWSARRGPAWSDPVFSLRWVYKRLPGVRLRFRDGFGGALASPARRQGSSQTRGAQHYDHHRAGRTAVKVAQTERRE